MWATFRSMATVGAEGRGRVKAGVCPIQIAQNISMQMTSDILS